MTTRWTTMRRIPKPAAPARLGMGFALAAAWLTPAIAAGADALVTIKGGPTDSTLHNYEWTVKNHHTSPIVCVEFPHFRADTFFAPQGWDTSKTTYLVNVGVPDKPGVCVAEVKPPNPGILCEVSRTFGMRITANRAPLGTGTVKIRFADGTETTVAGVELPEPPEPSAKYIPLIGLGGIFAIWVIVRTLRRRHAGAASALASPVPPEDGS